MKKEMIRVGIYVYKDDYYKKAAELKKIGRNISEWLREKLSKKEIAS